MNDRITVRIADTRPEGPKATTLYVDAGMEVLPGQFLMVADFAGGEKPFSVSEAEGGRLGITVREYGPFSRRLRSMEKGGLLSLRGPYGRPFTPRPGDCLLVGGGSGIAPLHLLARAILAAGGRVTVVSGARTRDEILLGDRFRRLPLDYHETAEDEGEGLTAVDLAARVMERKRPDFVYAAGPEGMLAALRPRLGDLDYQFSLERYMKCGVGICGSCTCDPTGIRICVEGPVLDRDRIEELEDFGRYKRDASGARVYFPGALPGA